VHEKHHQDLAKYRHWYEFFQHGAGLKAIIIILLATVLVTILLIYLGYFLSEWTQEPYE